MSKHIMGDLPDKKLAGAAPFVYTAIDMFGPWTTTGIAKGRGSFKTWGVMFSCLTTKSVAILACPGYDTDAFTLTYRISEPCKDCPHYATQTTATDSQTRHHGARPWRRGRGIRTHGHHMAVLT